MPIGILTKDATKVKQKPPIAIDSNIFDISIDDFFEPIMKLSRIIISKRRKKTS
ncbi:MAG: hypothetical protein WCJ54_02905 [Actinomycetota bacterium]